MIENEPFENSNVTRSPKLFLASYHGIGNYHPLKTEADILHFYQVSEPITDHKAMQQS